MIKRLFYLGILSVLLCNCTSKNRDKQAAATNDSIKKYLALAGNDTLDFKLRDKYNDKAFSLVDLKKNDTLTRFYLSSISCNYIKVEQFEKYKISSKYHFKKSIVAKDTLNVARYYRFKGVFFNSLNIYDSAFYYYIKAEKFYKKINDNASSAYMKTEQGIVQFTIGDYAGSELSLLKSYSFLKNSDKKEKLYGTLNQLGLVYNELTEYNKSLLYHKKALETVFKYKLNDAQHYNAVCYNNIGYLYLNQKKYQKAIRNLELGLKSKKIINDDVELYALLNSNLAFCKLKMNDYKECKKLLFEALLFREKLKGKVVMINIYLYLSQYYNKIGDNELSIEYCKKSLNEAKKSKSKLDVLVPLKYAIVVDRKNSQQYILEYIRIYNEIQFEERKTKERFDKIQFETLEITQEKETAVKQKWIISAVAGLVIVIIIFLLIIFWQKSKRKELELRQSQQKANEEIYDLMLLQKCKEDIARQGEKKRIALELHDGVMNRLASTRLNLGILFHKNDEETIQKCITEIDGIYEIEQEIRHIAHDLKSEIFNEKNSFISLLKEFVVVQNNVTNTTYILENDKLIDWNSISSSVKMNLYRIIQEASNNINKFAKATTAIICFALDENKLCLSIIDNGKGFDPKINSEGIGLKNIKQRVESLKGELVIQSKKNKKTSLNIVFSIK